MPASHDRMTTAVRSASGPPPVSHGRTTSHSSTGDRAKPASHSLRRQSGRPVVGRIAGPYRHCHAVGRTRAGHVHAGRIADGVNSRGAARRAQHLAASAGLARGAGSPAARGRDATGTPGRARPLTTNHHHSDDPVPLCCHRRELARSSWGPARQSGRPGPTIIRADQVGLRMPLASAAAAPQPDPPDSPGHWPAHPGTPCLQRHSQATRTRRAHRPQAGRSGPTGDSDAPPAARAVGHRATTVKLGLGRS